MSARPAAEPVAIVAMGCRFPGGVRTPEDLWSLLCAGRDAISGFPDNRGWDLSGFDGQAVLAGGFVDDVDRFDAAFFGISPREALAIDPQQRLLLEVSWEALERAGIDPASLHGSQGGVFVGISGNDYLARRSPDSRAVRTHLVMGAAASVASGRIAYTFGLQGPAVSLDTAASSSLVALHLAVQALRCGECTLALAGGVTVMATPDTFAMMGTDSAGAPDGRSKAFSAEADGAGWSEGAGMLVLERLSDARRNGHPVLALLTGSAINQDGRSQGLSAPNGPAQERVIRQALASARLSPGDIDAVEAHGTGTALGDPIEAQALLATYGEAHTPEQPLWLGSLKSNIGHAQAAAGVGGVIKMVLALQHGLLPGTLHAENPSPHIDWSSGTLRLLTEAVPWSANGRPRRAGVSSFGISGTNAHVVLEEAPILEEALAYEQAGAGAPAALPVLLSARSEAALRGQAERLREHVLAQPDLRLADLAYSLATTRTAFEHRAAILADSNTALVTALDAIGRGDSAPGTTLGRARGGGKVVFLFTGQGSQYAGMGRALYEAFPVFRDALDACCAHLDDDLERPLREVMFAAEGSEAAALLDHTGFAQPALFALEVALFRLLESLGLKPDLLLGHSIGELAAAHVAGVLSLSDACTLVAARARLMQALRQDGAMVAVQASEGEVSTLIAGQDNSVSIAALNGLASTVLSGDADAVRKIAVHFESMGRKTTRLKVSHAFHSHHMDGMLEAFHRVAGTLSWHRPRLPLVSNLTGVLATNEQLGDPGYWVRHVRQAVRFLDGVHTARSEGGQVFVELGPQGVLTALTEGILDEEDSANLSFFAMLRKGHNEAAAAVAALAGLWTRGVAFDWPAFFAPHGPHRTDLPTYAFQRERFWLEAPRQRATDLTSAGLSAAEHPWLAAAVVLADSDGFLLTGRLSLAEHPWLADHAVFGTPILPGTALVEMALFAAGRVGLNTIEELTLEAPLALPAEGAVQLQLSVGAADGDGRRPLSIHARAGDAAEDAPWTRHVSGLLGGGGEAVAFDLHQWPPAGAEPLPVEGLYERLATAGGLAYGPAFQGLRAAWRRGREVFAEAVLPDDLAAGDFALHPAVLDAALHALALALDEGGAVQLPFSWSGVSLRAAGATTLRVRLDQVGNGTVSLALADAAGEPVGAVAALATRPVTAEQLQSALSARQAPLYHLHWTPASLAAARPCAGVILGHGSVYDPGLSLERYADLAALQAALDQGASAPDLVVVAFDSPPAFDPALAHRAAADGLALLQSWLADERLTASRLVLLTTRAVATRPDEDVPGLVHAPLWGLARTAQSEHPERTLFLIDSDGSEASRALLAAVLSSDERQYALRNGQALVPRLGRIPRMAAATARHLDPDGTVLITGGTGTLGGLVARHLVATHGVRHLLLTSRQGPAAAATALRSDLEAAGAVVTIVACDASRREALQSLLEAIPATHPLTAVLHAAGTVDDGLLAALTDERLDKVLAPKLDAAWHLHDLTRDRDLAAFVLFSSLSGLSGAPGQASYAAANVFLDALAHHRQALGLAATSLAWGYWSEASGLTGHLQAADIARMRRAGILPLSSTQGLAFLDAALNRAEALQVAARFDPGALAASGELPALLRSLVHTRRTATNVDASSFAQRLLALPESERERAVLDVVRREVATVVGLTSPGALDIDRPLQEIGLDSLMAVEIRNRLAAATGTKLLVTLLFDHPTPAALSRYLTTLFAGRAAAPQTVLLPAVAGDDEPIAIVAMGCRFPGGVRTPEDLWSLLCAGRDAISGFPDNRGWDLGGFDGQAARAGGFVDDADRFDAAFFGISPREALAIDPQQRLLLEVSWEALERAGVDPTSLHNSQSGVFVGIYSNDYLARLSPDSLEAVRTHLATGSATSVASGRIAYTLGLQGPAVSLDTACSSSLVALHWAAQALRRGECTLALCCPGPCTRRTPLPISTGPPGPSGFSLKPFPGAQTAGPAAPVCPRSASPAPMPMSSLRRRRPLRKRQRANNNGPGSGLRQDYYPPPGPRFCLPGARRRSGDRRSGCASMCWHSLI